MNSAIVASSPLRSGHCTRRMALFFKGGLLAASLFYSNRTSLRQPPLLLRRRDRSGDPRYVELKELVRIRAQAHFGVGDTRFDLSTSLFIDAQPQWRRRTQLRSNGIGDCHRVKERWGD